ncbi:MAG: sulfatase/phosphatase domain-containing protein, partial [Planctomycetaceae bacterium]
NTIFIFTSDNGGETNVTSNKPLRGGKSQLYEGGIRVPMIVRWPSQVPENAVNRQPTVNVDFYPTLLEVLGEQPIEKQLLDGVSILSTLKDPTQTPRRNALYWHYPLDRPHFLGGVSAGAVRKGNWKLIEFYETGKTELYSLGDDPGEHSDLSAEQPETTAGLKAELANWRKTIGARIPSSPIMSETRKLVFEDSFDPVSSRWFFQKFWSVEDGVLKRNSFPAGNQRIFLRKPVFKDTLIRFDFRFDGAREIRLMTGTPGKYNAVIHIRPTDFLIQTARDQSVPYYPTFQGECLQDFQTGQWYTMTVEIVGEEIVVHTDHAHVSVASHPILDRERSYFAFQVDQPGASFDNVEILSAVPQRDWPQRREKFIRAQSDRPGIRRAAGDQLKIEMTNLRDRLHRTDPQYRRLVADIDVQKTREHARFPDVFTTIKSVRKEIDGYRRRLIASDPDYKSLRNAVNAARRKEREYLLSQDPSIADRPSGRIEAAVERIRLKVRQADDYLALISSRERLERDLQKKYPRLFVTDQEILQAQREARTRRNSDQEFRAQLKATAAAVRAEREYLETVDSKLKKLSAEAARLKAAASQTR